MAVAPSALGIPHTPTAGGPLGTAFRRNPAALAAAPPCPHQGAVMTKRLATTRPNARLGTDGRGQLGDRGTARREPDNRSAKGAWLVLVAMTGSLSMIMLDQTVVTVALPSMARDLSLSPTGQQWVVGAY